MALAFAASPVAYLLVPENVASTVTLLTPDPVLEDMSPAPAVSFNQVIEHPLASATPAPVIDYVTPALPHPMMDYVASSPVIPHISPTPTATFQRPVSNFLPLAAWQTSS